MATISLYDQDGKKKSDLPVSDQVFGLPLEKTLIYEAVRAQQANARTAIAHTKTRGEVRGGGKKPWKQKHTGRARHGSIRSPIWVGGGVTFGPRSNRNFSLKINRQAKKRAMCVALSSRLVDGKLFAIDKLDLSQPKTKDLAKILSSMPASGEMLLVLDRKNDNVEQAAKNIKTVWVARPEAISVVDVMKYRRIIIVEGALSKMEKIFAPVKRA